MKEFWTKSSKNFCLRGALKLPLTWFRMMLGLIAMALNVLEIFIMLWRQKVKQVYHVSVMTKDISTFIKCSGTHVVTTKLGIILNLCLFSVLKSMADFYYLSTRCEDNIVKH